jgi:hypothetical protein
MDGELKLKGLAQACFNLRGTIHDYAAQGVAGSHQQGALRDIPGEEVARLDV